MEVPSMPMPLLVELVNGWGTVPRARADAREKPSIPEFVERHDVPDALAARFGDTALVRLADELYPVFAAAEAGERASVVSDLLARSGVRPALAPAGEAIAPAWQVSRTGDVLPAAAAVALYGQLAAHDPERMGTCAAERCGDAFVDTSPGAHRRFCSVTCQNRERVAAFRRRRSGGGPQARSL